MGIFERLFGKKEKASGEKDSTPPVERSRYDELLTDAVASQFALQPLEHAELSFRDDSDKLGDDRWSWFGIMCMAESLYVMRQQSAFTFSLYRSNDSLAHGRPGPFLEYHYVKSGSCVLGGNSTQSLTLQFKSHLEKLGPSQWTKLIQNVKPPVTGHPGPYDRQITSFHYEIKLLLDPECETVKRWNQVRKAGQEKIQDPEVQALIARLRESDMSRTGACWLGASGIWRYPKYAQYGKKYVQTVSELYIEYPKIWNAFSFDEKLALAIAISESSEWIPIGAEYVREPNHDTGEWSIFMKTRTRLEEEAGAEFAKEMEEREARRIDANRKPFLDF